MPTVSGKKKTKKKGIKKIAPQLEHFQLPPLTQEELDTLQEAARLCFPELQTPDPVSHLRDFQRDGCHALIRGHVTM